MMDHIPAGRNTDHSQWQKRAAAAVLLKFRRRWLVVRLVEPLLRPLTWFSRGYPDEDLSRVKSILVFDSAHLGDIVNLTPFLRSLRERFPNARLAFLGQPRIEPLLRGQRLADELIPIRVPWAVHSTLWRRYNPFSLLWPAFAWQLIRLRKRHFDLAFTSGRSDLRHNFALWLTGARRRVGYGYAGGGFLLTDEVLPDLSRPHSTDLALRFLQHLEIPVTRASPLLNVPEEDQYIAKKILSECGVAPEDFLVGIHAGTRWPARQWGEEKFRELARQIVERYGGKIIWFSDPAERRNIPRGPNIFPVSLPLGQFLAVLTHCRLLVCNEGGPMHMAAGLGLPVVAIFGPTQPEWFGPRGDEHRVVIRRDVWCRPCADHCLFGEPYCLRLIPVEQVMEAVAEVIESLSLASTNSS